MPLIAPRVLLAEGNQQTNKETTTSRSEGEILKRGEAPEVDGIYERARPAWWNTGSDFALDIDDESDSQRGAQVQQTQAPEHKQS